MSNYLDIKDFLDISLPELNHQQEIELAISVQSNFIPFKNVKDLSGADRMRYRKGSADRERLIRSNLKLVKKVTKRFESSRIEMKLLLDFGMVGLITATETFNPYLINPESGLPYKFSTHATWQIMNEMNCGISKYRAIRIPAWVIRSLAQVKKVTKKLTITLGRKPDDTEILAEMPPTGKLNKPFTQERLDFLRRSQFINDMQSIDAMAAENEDGYTASFDIKDPFDIWHEIELKEELKQLTEIKAKTNSKKKKSNRKKRKKRSLVIKDFSKKISIGCQLGLKISIKKKPKQKSNKSTKMITKTVAVKGEQLTLDLEADSILNFPQFDRDVRRYA